MSHFPFSSINVSLNLSEVLSDIAVNERLLQKRRRMKLLTETLSNTSNRLFGLPETLFTFGSQSEGSTTYGLQSDIDTLYCNNMVHVVQDWSDRQHGMFNVLMIQDETTQPGYCLLQRLREDEPLPLLLSVDAQTPDTLFFKDRKGRALMKNSLSMANCLKYYKSNLSRNGPAESVGRGLWTSDEDHVIAFQCKAWPDIAKPWLVRQGIGAWPTEEMKRYCETTGCFVVPVSSKSGQNEELEWRISTSCAERCLVFNLNITQIRCYILMKMILKTFINPQCNGVLSSFMCKTVLFHCIQNTHTDLWLEHNLLACLNWCLTTLLGNVTQTNCPHFIIPGNNLMTGRISPVNKKKILETLQHIIQSEGRALLEITIDGLGLKLWKKMNLLPLNPGIQNCNFNTETSAALSAHLVREIAHSLCNHMNAHLYQLGNNPSVHLKTRNIISTLVTTYSQEDSNSLDKVVCRLIIQPLCSVLGSVIASQEILTNNTISHEAQAWFSMGLNSDVASGRLKLASAFYCSGNIERAEFLLRNAEDIYDTNKTEPVCSCYNFPYLQIMKPEFINKSNTGNEELIQHITAFCVKYIQREINCVPHELKYEMFRSTQEDMIYRHAVHDSWVDWAVVDALPYLYFLQYKTYGHLQRPAGQQCALEYLATTINTEPNLGHRETALNLLGQCMEQENRYNDALHCYRRSLKIRPRLNAAKIHICKLLNELVNRRVR